MGGYERGLDGFKHNLRLELALDTDVVDSHDQFVFHALCALLVLDQLSKESLPLLLRPVLHPKWGRPSPL